METVEAEQWVVLGTNGGAVLMEEIPGGRIHHFPPGLLPDDLRAGDRFRVVARMDRRSD